MQFVDNQIQTSFYRKTTDRTRRSLQRLLCGFDDRGALPHRHRSIHPRRTPQDPASRIGRGHRRRDPPSHIGDQIPVPSPTQAPGDQKIDASKTARERERFYYAFGAAAGVAAGAAAAGAAEAAPSAFFAIGFLRGRLLIFLPGMTFLSISQLWTVSESFAP